LDVLETVLFRRLILDVLIIVLLRFKRNALHGSSFFNYPDPRSARGRGPFHDDVSQNLALDSVARLEVQLELSKLCGPLGDVACGVRVVENGP
jgi:hypothetical protein